MKVTTAFRFAIGCALAVLVSLAVMVSMVSGANAQEWPTRPITFVVPYAAGSDYVPRLLGAELEKILGQKVIIENRTGAGGATGTAYVARQPPDGYTIVLTAPGPGAIYLNTMKDLSYHPINDFEHISLFAAADSALIVRSDFPANDFKEFIAYAKANPGKISAGNNGIGTPGNMSLLVLADRYGFDIKHIPYRGGSAEIGKDMLSGAIEAAADTFGNTHVALVTDGKLKVLALFSEARSQFLPNVPTIKEQGYDFSAQVWIGAMAPKGTPRPIIDKLNAAIRQVVSSDYYKEKLAANAQRAVSSTPEEFRKIAIDEEAKWRDVIKKYNIVSQ